MYKRRALGDGHLAIAGALRRPGAALAATLGTTTTAAAPFPHPAPGLVLPLAPDPRVWDSLTVSCPRVLRFGPRDFRLWYFGGDRQSSDFDGAPGESDAGSVGWPQVLQVRPDL